MPRDGAIIFSDLIGKLRAIRSLQQMQPRWVTFTWEARHMYDARCGIRSIEPVGEVMITSLAPASFVLVSHH